jgi:Delta7-sterol 5-desaturase
METFLQSWFTATILNSARYFIISGLAFIPFYIIMKGRFEKEKIQSKIAGKKDFYREIKDSFSTMIIFGINGGILIGSPLREYTQIYYEISDFGWLYLVLTVPLALIIHDTYFYWTHKWLHSKKLYKKYHLTHHLSINPTPWTSYTFGWVEGMVQGGIIFVLVFLIPMHTYAIFAFTLTAFVINVYGHLGYEIAPLGLRNTSIFSWIGTSTYHNMHHSKFNGNFGLYFRWWDKWMGTELKDYEAQYDKIQERRLSSNNSPDIETEIQASI